MQITEVKKKKCILTGEEISAIKQVINILDIISGEDEICKAIQYEAYVYGDIGEDIDDAQAILDVLLNIDKIDINC